MTKKKIPKSFIAQPRHPKSKQESIERIKREIKTPGSLESAVKESTKEKSFARDKKREESSTRGKDRVVRTVPVASDNADTEGNSRFSRLMAGSKRGMGRTGMLQHTDAVLAAPRPYDPVDYWKQIGIPYRQDSDEEMKKQRMWCRLYYATHYLIPSLIDIYTRFPLLGMELDHEDKKIKDFYTSIFMDENALDYPQHLTNVGRERWTIGEAFVLGSWNDTLGIWEREEILNPDDINVNYFQLFGTRTFEIKPPPYLKDLINGQTTDKTGQQELQMLRNDYPELFSFVERDMNIPVSDVLLKQLMNKINHWDKHGTPILMRAFRTLMHEEKLNACQDAVAERLYSPLILAQLGMKDIGDGEGPWIPDEGALQMFRDDFDLALASDFRVLVYHFGLEIKNVFGRESVPRLDQDYDRVEKKLMQIFGMNPAILQGGTGVNTYAGQALNIELLSLLMQTYQREIQTYYKQRAEVVAEAHEHYAYETSGNQRIPIYEEVLEWVEPGEEYNEDGAEGIWVKVKQPALTTPNLKMKTLNLRDMNQEREFLKMLKDMGVPIPDDKFMVGVDWTPEELMPQFIREKVDKIVAEQEYVLQTYKTLKARNLPIPQEIKDKIGDFDKDNSEVGGGKPNVAPGDAIPVTQDSDEASDNAKEVDKDETELETDSGDRPEVSDEARSDMPKTTIRIKKKAMPERLTERQSIILSRGGKRVTALNTSFIKRNGEKDSVGKELYGKRALREREETREGKDG